MVVIFDYIGIYKLRKLLKIMESGENDSNGNLEERAGIFLSKAAVGRISFHNAVSNIDHNIISYLISEEHIKLHHQEYTITKKGRNYAARYVLEHTSREKATA